MELKKGFGKATKRGGLASEAKKEALQCFMFLALPIIGFFALHLYPMLWSMKWSFFNYNMTPSDTKFIGLGNFKSLFTKDAMYWKSWLNTLQLAALKIPIEISLTLFIALILSQKHIKGKTFFRTFYFLPNIVGVVIYGLVFSNIFTYFGVANDWLMKLGLISEPIDWLKHRSTAFTMLVASSIWASFGINVMYFLSALSNVSEELYESAMLDGANAATRFFKITIPCILPVFSTIILLSIIGTLDANVGVIVLTGGAPNGGTNTVMSYLTQKFMPGFAGKSPEIGYGSAASLVTTVMFVIIGIIHNRLSKAAER